MANHKSAKKRCRQTLKRNEVNRSLLSKMKNNINIYLASPRGFCAGVDRAIQIVEKAIKKFGPPIYVRHEIVHNKHVVEN